ncbi:hypothetical protein [Nitrosomonas sp.]|uniref:hypothetical protein n=1 Tax=Nitrosomonas sp. TaxID=42353 RepID=UPI002624AC83|nr:hypothetical protein [Nitrosomonas sp.]MCW5600178.1 hypothetical protein [Nitrosomonas sp.]
MSKKYSIINPKAKDVVGLYVDEKIDEDHPIASMRFTSLMQACLCYQQAMPLKSAIKSIRAHIRHLYGSGIPDELVVSAVTLTYAQQPALQPCQQKKAIDIIIAIDCKYIADWLLYSRRTREPVDVKTNRYWPFYPKVTLSGLAAGAVAWKSKLKFDDNTTREELQAEVTMNIMGSDYVVRGGDINWSASDRVFIVKTSHPRFAIREYPHIETYNCIAYYPKDTAKEALIAHAATIAATWCPSVRVVWSVEEEIWPNIE